MMAMLGICPSVSRLYCSKAMSIFTKLCRSHYKHIHYIISRHLLLSNRKGSASFAKRQTKVCINSGNLCTHRKLSSILKDKRLSLIDSRDKIVLNTLSKDMTVFSNFISEDEEKLLLQEVERYVKRLRYEYDHWDNAIHGFRETEKKTWNEANTQILQRVRETAFPSADAPMAYVHVLDISKDGYIKPHVDSVRFCGDTIAGLCLLSSCVMRLALEAEPHRHADVLLPRRGLYVMRGAARYDYTHEVLKEGESVFRGEIVPRERRISVICRNEPGNSQPS